LVTFNVDNKFNSVNSTVTSELIIDSK